MVRAKPVKVEPLQGTSIIHDRIMHHIAAAVIAASTDIRLVIHNRVNGFELIEHTEIINTD